ncbi:2-hydroxychromene-2-carboxylate isomerase [Massilia sp. TS11]|uniref:2-hydroxychromene-2-carboxylate isomerase n=1 Tax=Massilia sp. TS11 TaxID=2908003 RepID=UPI001EDA418B|nr:2-hydroxychromene-2-carboxylate isomerase [Massilia sp. TS11]MCG2584640.1 2-hydroxychromene-2-carboxylate isomerase [Massilia sp. TS11]
MKDVFVYYDPVSPYVWLATHQFGRLQDAGARLRLRPVLFAGLLNANGQKGPAEIPSKRDYTFRDVLRQATRQGLRFRGPPGHPFNPLLVLRMACALIDEDARLRFAVAASRACWEDGANLSDPATAAAIAEGCGLDGAALLAAAASAPVKQALADATAAALAAGVFGVPALACDGEIFWGADRIDALLWHLDGGRIDQDTLQDFLARPPLAQRKLAGG